MDTREVIEALFQNILQRGPDPSGQEAFEAAWAQGRGDEVVLAMLQSPEFKDLVRRKSLLQSRRRVGVVHVPKCAGTSLQQALTLAIKTYSGPVYFHRPATSRQSWTDWGGRSGTVGDIARVFGTHPVVVGHYPSGVLVEAGATDLFVTVREPRARLLSLFRFWQALPRERFSASPQLSRALDRGFDAFVSSQSNRAAVYGAVAAHALTDKATWRPGQSVLSAWKATGSFIRKAAWPNEFTRTVAEFCSLFGIPHDPEMPSERANVTPRAERCEEVLTDEIQSLLERLTRPDHEAISILMSEGLLTQKSPDDLEREYVEVAQSHGFVLER